MFETLKEMIKFLLTSFATYSGYNKIWILFPVALLVIWLLGKKEDRLFFFGTLLFEILTIFNPVVIYILLKKFDYTTRYHRFFWAVTFYLVIAYALVLLIGKFRKKIWRAVAAGLAVVLVVFLGKPVFFGEDVASYELVQNKYFIEDRIPELSEVFHCEGLERPVVLYGALMVSYRQYDPSVISTFGKNILMKVTTESMDEFCAEDAYTENVKTICKVYYYRDFTTPASVFAQCLYRRKVDYVVSDSEEMDAYLSTDDFSLIGQTSTYRVWKVVGAGDRESDALSEF
jgi:multidrug transporter EmrE-like cation transporter